MPPDFKVNLASQFEPQLNATETLVPTFSITFKPAVLCMASRRAAFWPKGREA